MLSRPSGSDSNLKFKTKSTNVMRNSISDRFLPTTCQLRLEALGTAHDVSLSVAMAGKSLP